MITCAIVDDEPLALGLLKSYVTKTPQLTLRGEYTSAIEALDGLKSEPVDLVFLDIQMPEMSGLDLSKLIDPRVTRIVFTTAFSQYALDGYRVSALDYLLKPISYVDFVGAVSRAQEWVALRDGQTPEKAQDNDEPAEAVTLPEPAAGPGAGDEYMFVKSDYKIVRIDYADILYIEGLKDYVKIYLASSPRPVLTLLSMRTIEETLPSQRFYRVHRSFIVNMERVQVFERGQIIFGEKRIPVSDSYKASVQDYINAHLLMGRS